MVCQKQTLKTVLGSLKDPGQVATNPLAMKRSRKASEIQWNHFPFSLSINKLPVWKL